MKKLGADECLDYRSSTFNEDLVKATDGYVNVYFDNVRSGLRSCSEPGTKLTRAFRWRRLADRS